MQWRRCPKQCSFFEKHFINFWRVIQKRSVKSVMQERQHLESLKHPFLVNMICSFQDRENLYLVMDLLSGGDLRYHMSMKHRFTEEQTSLFTSFNHFNSIKNSLWAVFWWVSSTFMWMGFCTGILSQKTLYCKKTAT